MIEAVWSKASLPLHKVRKKLELRTYQRRRILLCCHFFMSPAQLEALTLLKASFVDEAEAVYESFGEDLDESGQIWSRSGSNTSTRSARATFSQVTSL